MLSDDVAKEKVKRKIYFAAPLFTHSERVWNRKLANAIDIRCPDIKVILPQDEAEKAYNNKKIDFKKVFEICIEGIDSSDIVLAIFDGPDSDSGTSFECGYSYANNKRIIGVRTDLRRGENRGVNAMLSQSCDLIKFDAKRDSENDINKLANKIVNKIFKTKKS